MDEDDRQTCLNIRSAVRIAFPGRMVSKMVVIAETIEQDGHRSFWATADPDMMPWELRGLMEFALDHICAEDDDE